MDAQFLGHEDAAALFIEIAQKGHVDLEFIEMIVMQDVERRIGTAEVVAQRPDSQTAETAARSESSYASL